jgi:sortase A
LPVGAKLAGQENFVMRLGFKIIGVEATEWLAQPAEVPKFARPIFNAPVIDRYQALLKSFEICLWALAVTAIGYCSVAYAGAAIHQHREKAILNAVSRHADWQQGARPGDAVVPSFISANSSATLGYGVLGVVEIPRLGISTVVEEGVDESTLWEAVGHIPGTAQPGQNGNAALAAHRDTYFSGLGEVEAGDLVIFRSPTANYEFRVESTKIVDGEATDALPDSASPTLSLITCYPFHYVGAAPQRFIVTARAESASQ